MAPTARPRAASRAQSIRLRRSPSLMDISAHLPSEDDDVDFSSTAAFHFEAPSSPSTTRPRSTSAPQTSVPRRKPVPSQGGGPSLPPLAEDSRLSMSQRPPDMLQPEQLQIEENLVPPPRGVRRYLPRMLSSNTTETRPRSTTIPHGRPRSRATSVALSDGGHEYDANLVDLLDLVDPEVQTLGTLNNVQNSLFIPNFGRWLNRQPTYDLSRRDEEETESSSESEEEKDESGRKEGGRTRRHRRASETKLEDGLPRSSQMARLSTAHSLSRPPTHASILSIPTEEHYAVLPHGVRLEDWSAQDKRDLDDHVRHMLHSRRSRFKRSMKGFGQYVRKPLGFFVTLYATLITLFGLAWVLFLIGWINVGGRKDYLVNIIDNVLVALFAIMGDGLIPWRIVDTYHMIWIAHYAHTTWRLRREKALPELANHNDLPIVRETDVEAADLDDKEVSVLSELQQKRLAHHQAKFAASHTFYKPHETMTHHAFPIRLLIAVVVLLDCHSCLQLSLGLCTWIINYHVRPFALTTVILCCSITVNITAGILISVGDHRTRKKDVLERMHKQALTAEAMRKLDKRRRKEEERMQLLEEEESKVRAGPGKGDGLEEQSDLSEMDEAGLLHVPVMQS